MGKLQSGFADQLAESVKYVAWLNATPEWPQVEGRKKAPPKERSRREDIEEYVGRQIMPYIPGGDYLLAYFFEFGPATKDGAVEPPDVESWARILGIEWKPWQARLFVRLSREYVAEQHRAKGYHAEPPWPGAVSMWRWVRAQQTEHRAKETLKQELPKDGNRKRHRS